MKLRNASVKIALGMVNIDVMMMDPKIFGNMCLVRILELFAPSVTDARTYS
jgi:hypothetical protein